MRFSPKTLVALSLSLATVGVAFPINFVEAQVTSPLTSEATSEETSTFEQVDAYVEAWQLEDAIALLEGVVAEGSQLPEVYQKLGDLYVQAGYDAEKAAKSYATAMQLAQESGDLEAEADAQVALADLASQYGRINIAENLLQEAQGNYEAVDNSEKVTLVQERLAVLPENSDENATPLPTLRGASSSTANDPFSNELNLCIPCLLN